VEGQSIWAERLVGGAIPAAREPCTPESGLKAGVHRTRFGKNDDKIAGVTEKQTAPTDVVVHGTKLRRSLVASALLRAAFTLL
jgi:hypothetical protein